MDGFFVTGYNGAMDSLSGATTPWNVTVGHQPSWF